MARTLAEIRAMMGDALEDVEPCKFCGATLLCGMCCGARAKEERTKWQADQLAAITERRKAKAKRKYLAKLLFKFSGK